ncbi:hypothetical protein BDV25DRAFT_135255 [Aspergillus avenaceus]|uniref:Uncharacterized protein n=1 Tax=Aspergillus avenaceus TaxID=36643 RepID=A0A5N6U9B4_ASPAV|nr:hypothetical protein BDV25DRAFT_135255 [Aspergillus avenaceus]
MDIEANTPIFIHNHVDPTRHAVFMASCFFSDNSSSTGMSAYDYSIWLDALSEQCQFSEDEQLLRFKIKRDETEEYGYIHCRWQWYSALAMMHGADDEILFEIVDRDTGENDSNESEDFTL